MGPHCVGRMQTVWFSLQVVSILTTDFKLSKTKRNLQYIQDNLCNSAVGLFGIATRYQLEDPGFETRCWSEIFSP